MNAPSSTAPGVADGLSEREAAARFDRDGPNELPAPEKRKIVDIAIGVLSEPMFAMLLAASAIYLVLGDFTEAVALSLFATFSGFSGDLYLIARSVLDSPAIRPSITIPRTFDIAVSYSSRTALLATGIGVSVYGLDREQMVREMPLAGGTTRIAIDDERRRAFVLRGQTIRAINF